MLSTSDVMELSALRVENSGLRHTLDSTRAALVRSRAAQDALQQQLTNTTASLAAEKAARRSLEARLEPLRRRALDDPAVPMLKRMRKEIDEYLHDVAPRPYDFKVPV